MKSDGTLITTFNEMKTGFKKLIETLKNNNIKILDELQKKVESFSFGEKIQTVNEIIEENENEKNEENKNEIIEDNKVENKEEKDIMNDLNKFLDKKFELPKYKLNILKNHTFEVTKGKNDKKNYEKLTLDNEAIYYIVDNMYEDSKDLVDQTEYDLDKQITVRSLSKKLLFSNVTNEELRLLLQWLDNEDNILIFLLLSRNHSAPFNGPQFEIVTTIFKRIIEKMCVKHNKEIERHILIIADTLYKLQKGNKIYISAEIKGHKLFNDKIFWENVFEYAVNDDMKKNEGENKKKEAEMTNLMALCNSLNYLCDDTDKKNEIIRILLKKCHSNDKKVLEANIKQLFD